MADNDGDSDAARVLKPLQAAACTYRIAFGPRAGQKLLTVHGAMPRQTDFKQTLCLGMQGFRLHAAVRCGADDRQRARPRGVDGLPAVRAADGRAGGIDHPARRRRLERRVFRRTCRCVSQFGLHGVPLLVALLGLRAAGNALKGVLKNPLPWAIVLGCLTTATGFELWEPARNTVGMLADGASPVALFTIGAVLARPQKAAATGTTGAFGDVPLEVFYKLVVHPALVLGVGKLAQSIGRPLGAFALTVLVVLTALPGASSIPMLAERFDADAGRIARTVPFATAVSFVTFSAAVALLV